MKKGAKGLIILTAALFVMGVASGPATAAVTLNEIARLTGTPVESIASAAAANTRRLFPRLIGESSPSPGSTPA